VTEIPEHLLRRSKAAKAGKAGEGEPAAETGSEAGAPGPARAPAAQAPATRPAAPVPAEPAPEPVKPDPPYIAAYKQRRRIPVWALPVVVFLPIWALSFAGTMQVPVKEDPLLAEAASLYTALGCAACHGPAGQGGIGHQFSAGEINLTFPEPIDQMVHIARGSAPIVGQAYGDPDRPGGAHVAGDLGVMPAFPNITLLELEMVTYHERAVLSTEVDPGPEFEAWVERMRADLAAHVEQPIDLEFLLSCANPEYTPGATGENRGDEACPGPVAEP
jgi:hypothetical protein